MKTPQSPPAGGWNEIDEILYMVGDHPKEWHEDAKTALRAYILAEVLKAKPRKQQLVLQQTKLTDYQLGYNEAISDFEKAATARFGGKS